jgi:Calcineurin-like phosphoesterase
MFWQISTAVIVAFIAILATVKFKDETNGSKQSNTKLSSNRQTYVIGDLHGDVECAKYWVKQIKVVDNINNPKSWLQDDATLVFMGDYIDKGPFSYQTLMFVKSLTDEFPDKVTALMGNHEMELLKDRHPRRNPKYYHYAYSVVHPNEFRNFIQIYRDIDDDDELVIELLLNASMEVYSRNLHRSARFAPETKVGPTIIDFVLKDHHKDLVRTRLTEYQLAYESSFYSNTTLGKWLEGLKVAHVENGVLFTHGGVDTEIASMLKRFKNVTALNNHVRENAGNERFLEFLSSSETGAIVQKMLFYRGNHKPAACDELSRILHDLEGVYRLAVGHTPGKYVRIMCENQFLALDSLLGRWIRTSGNYYCPTTSREVSNFRCPTLEEKCLGQIVQIGGDGTFRIINSTQE